jgi:hypothetical protein
LSLVVRRFVDKPLSHLTPPEDFMLGMLLGYAADQQCRRLLGRLGQPESGNLAFLELATRRRVFAS